jgi:prepilin peptidase CpaA
LILSSLEVAEFTFVDSQIVVCENPPIYAVVLRPNETFRRMSPLKDVTLLIAAILALIAGWTDWRRRRIPNWLTIPGLLVGIAINAVAGGWLGAKLSLEGAGLGLLLLFPFVLVRALGAGDWKLTGALGAFLGPHRLLVALAGAILLAGLMAVILIVYRRRVGQTLRNIGRVLFAFATGHPGVSSVSLDNPESLKIPFGVAMTAAVVLLAVARLAFRVLL